MAPKDEKYATSAGFGALMQLIAASRFKMQETEAELKSRIAVSKGKTKLKLECKRCDGEAVYNPMIFTFVASKGMSKKCSGACWGSWKSDARLEKLALKVRNSRFELTESVGSLKSRIVNQKTKLMLKCTVCDSISVSCTIADFWTNGSAECSCSRSPAWCSDAGMQRLQELIESSRFALTVDLQFLRAEVVKHGCNTLLPLRCTDCGATSDNCAIDQFRVYKSAKCNCTAPQTESRVRKWCEEAHKGTVGVFGQLRAPDCGLPMDIVITCMKTGNWILVIEVDGDQHFMRSMALSGNTAKNDLIKEKAVLGSGVPVVRLHQPTVWYNIDIVKTFDWRSFLAKHIDDAIAGLLAVKVHHPGCKVYTEGLYAELRN
jgi:hypothetical protein